MKFFILYVHVCAFWWPKITKQTTHSYISFFSSFFFFFFCVHRVICHVVMHIWYPYTNTQPQTTLFCNQDPFERRWIDWLPLRMESVYWTNIWNENRNESAKIKMKLDLYYRQLNFCSEAKNIVCILIVALPRCHIAWSAGDKMITIWIRKPF